MSGRGQEASRGIRVWVAWLRARPNSEWIYCYLELNFPSMVLWCSWLSLLSNTQAVPGSSPGGIIVLPVLCDMFDRQLMVV